MCLKSTRRGSAPIKWDIMGNVMPRQFYLIAIIASLIVAAATQARADDVLLVTPRIYNFPGQQLCQVDRNDRRYREFCAPPSYHPLGATGYRPLGTYVAYRPHRFVRRPWPSAKVVTIDPQN